MRFGFFFCCLMFCIISIGCAERKHLSDDYGRSYRQLFTSQGLSQQRVITPVNAVDAKRILKRKENQTRRSSRSRSRNFSGASGSRLGDGFSESIDLE